MADLDDSAVYAVKQIDPQERRWMPVSEQWPLAIRPLDEGGYELSLFLRSLPGLHAAIQSAKGKPHPALAKSVAAAIVEAIGA